MTDSLPALPVTPMLPPNESERLAALHRYQVLDPPPEVAFDRITTLVARLFKTPTVLISLVDESRAWFKSNIGFGTPEVCRNDALCNFAVLTNVPLNRSRYSTRRSLCLQSIRARRTSDAVLCGCAASRSRWL